MKPSESLGRLFCVVGESLLLYLGDSSLWSHPGNEKLKESLSDLVAVNRSLLSRIASAMATSEGTPQVLEYPIRFTATHDLDVEFLSGVVASDFRARSETCSELLRLCHADDQSDALVSSLLQEVRDSTLEYAVQLEQLRRGIHLLSAAE
ncbi:MAG: hypothetical protein WCR23_11560 [Planctomycetota bacterium]